MKAANVALKPGYMKWRHRNIVKSGGGVAAARGIWR
jgi:hypothetical protein